MGLSIGQLIKGRIKIKVAEMRMLMRMGWTLRLGQTVFFFDMIYSITTL